MTPLALLPVLVVALAGPVLFVALRNLRAELDELGRETGRLRELRPALVRVRTEADEARARARALALRDRRHLR